MHDVSALYREILEEPDHYKEIRAVIGLREQTVVNWSIIASVNESVAVGGTSARQLYLDIIPNGFIADSAPVSISVRLSSKDGKRKSEWIPKGTYLIDTMSTDMETGVMSIFGFDFMMKTEQPFLQDGETASGWPKTPTQVMSRICAAIGVSLDSRTHLNDAFTVPFPTKKSLEDNAADSAANGPPYILNTDTKIIHRRSCRRVSTIAPENRRQSDDNSTVAALEATGYRVCRVCRPSDSGSEPDTSASLSMRTVAGNIAAMNGGNWIVTDFNTLYLVPFEIFESSLRLLSTENQRALLFGNSVILL